MCPLFYALCLCHFIICGRWYEFEILFFSLRSWFSKIKGVRKGVTHMHACMHACLACICIYVYVCQTKCSFFFRISFSEELIFLKNVLVANPIGADGVSVLAEALKVNSTLHREDLSSMSISSCQEEIMPLYFSFQTWNFGTN